MRGIYLPLSWSTGHHPGILPHPFHACAAARDISDFLDVFCFPCRAQTSQCGFCCCTKDFMQDFEGCFATEGVQD